MKLKGIKIVSDGTVMGTRVFSADGEDITKKLVVRSVNWSHDATGLPVAELTCLLASIEASNVEATIIERDPRRPDAEILSDQFRLRQS